MSYARGGLGAIPTYQGSNQPDPVAYAIQETLIPSREAWDQAMVDTAGTLANNPELAALARAYDAARSQASGTAALGPDDLIANMRQNGYGLPAGTPAAILNRYGTAWEKYFRAFLAVFLDIPDIKTYYPASPAPPVAGPDTRYPLGVQLILGWRVPMPNDGFMRDTWPLVPLSPIVGYRVMQPMTDGGLSDGGVTVLPRVYVVRQLPEIQYGETSRQTGWYPVVFADTVQGVSFPNRVAPEADTWASVQADETALLALLNSSIPGAALGPPWGGLPTVRARPGGVEQPPVVTPWDADRPRPSGWTDVTVPAPPRATDAQGNEVPLIQGPDGVWTPAGAPMVDPRYVGPDRLAVEFPTSDGGRTIPDGSLVTTQESGTGGPQAAGLGWLLGLGVVGAVLMAQKKRRA